MAIWSCLAAMAGSALCVPVALSRSAATAHHFGAKLDAAYEATLLGFPIGDVTWTINLHDSRYSAVAHGTTAGLMLIFSRGHGNAEAQGSVVGKEPLVSNFLINITHGSASQEVRILFKHGKASESLAPPPKPNPQLVPLNEAYRTGVVDPMSALLVNVPGSGEMAGPAACARTIAVFDGRMRFNLKLAFKRIEQVQVPDGYHGAAVVCAVYFTPLAGYDPNRYAIKYLQAARGMEIWLAPLSGTRLMVPYRLSVPTPIGVGILQATHFVWSQEAGRAGAVSAN
ncbi:MAG TPA: DUF3108 domain-containing protein [Xanthobacteraceae bacterium]|nr:DUF3108 domain-containing protein [Xanthobacteraceae bacterium]